MALHTAVSYWEAAEHVCGGSGQAKRVSGLKVLDAFLTYKISKSRWVFQDITLSFVRDHQYAHRYFLPKLWK